MTVETKHKAYDASKAAWQKVRDFVTGGEAVKPYVLALPGHDANTIAAYRKRAYYLPAVARSVDAFTGLIMNPEPVIAGADPIQDYLDDVSYDGEPANRMIGRTVREIIEVGRCAVVVDYPQDPNAAQLSVAEAEARGLRAYARFYAAEDVLDWRVGARGGERILTFLKLRENFDQQTADDEWTVTQVEQIRVLDLVPGKGDTLKYRQRVYRKGDVTTDGKTVTSWTQVGDDIFPQANGATLEELPAVVFGPDSLDASLIDAPPVLEMVDVAADYLNTSALREWALLWVGNPTPVFINLNLPEGQTIALGSSQGINLREGGDAKYLYLPAEGVGAIREAMEDKRRDMAAVGARLLADETSAQIARDTAVIQRAGEHSVLANIATTVGDGWQRVLGYLALWAGAADLDISVTLNTDFIPQGLTSGELSELISAVQAGQLSSRDLFGLLQKRGVVRPDKSFEEHQDEIDEDGARLMETPPGGDPANDGDPNDPNEEQEQAA